MSVTDLAASKRPPRARRVPVPVDEPLLEIDDHGYADAFEIDLREGDRRTAEEFARASLEDAPAAVRWLIWNIHRHVLRLRLGPRCSASHVSGWLITSVRPDAVKLEAGGPLLTAVIVGRRTTPAVTRIVTSVRYERPAAAPLMETVVAPLHRRVARLLLERAVAAAPPGSRRS